jgi:hypothetical protein
MTNIHLRTIGFIALLTTLACQGPEAHHLGLTGVNQGTAGSTPQIGGGAGSAASVGAAGDSGGGGALPGAAGTLGGGAAGTVGGQAAGTSGGAAGTGGSSAAAGSSGAGTSGGQAGTTGTPDAGSAGTKAAAGTTGSVPDAGATAGTSGRRDAAVEAPPAGPYAASTLMVSASITAAGNADLPANAIDGNKATRWSTGRAQMGDEWFRVDLGAAKSISRVLIDDTSQPQDFPAAYTIETSMDGTAFAAVTMGAGMPTTTTIQFTPRTARYLRIRQTAMKAANWFSIDELTIWP